MFWGKKEKQTNVSIKVLLCPPCSLNVSNIRIQFRHNIRKCILFHCLNLLVYIKRRCAWMMWWRMEVQQRRETKNAPKTYLPQDRLLDIVDDARKPVFGFISSSHYWFSLIDKLSSYCWAISVWQTNNNQISIIGQRALITRRPILIHPAKPRPPAKSKQT